MTRVKVLKMCSILETVAPALCFACFLKFDDLDEAGAIRMNCKSVRRAGLRVGRGGKWFGDTKGVTGQQGCLFADIKIQVFRKRVCDSCVNHLKTEFVWVHAWFSFAM